MSAFVAVSVPSGDLVHTDFAMSLATMCLDPGAQVAVVNARSSLVPLGRNECVGAAQVLKATHLLFLDTDMVFPADTLIRLLAHDKDIVGATYSQRKPPFRPLAVAETGEPLTMFSGLRRARLLPTGCLLIRTAVFERLEKPWFNLATIEGNLLGEDYFFCTKALAAGFAIWCDGDLSAQVGHMGQRIYRIGEGEGA